MARKSTVLIAEDENTIAESLSFLMHKQGFEVGVAKDGDAAIAMAIRDVPDILLLDIMMPGCDGFEVVRTLRGDARTRDIPIIMLTARIREVDRRKGIELGVDDFVTKPFSTTDVVARVKSLLAEGPA